MAVGRGAMLLRLGLAALQAVRSEYFPSVDPSATWQAPRMLPWDPLRATFESVLVAWTPAWNPWCAVGHYELESRRPAGHALGFHELERLQLREVDAEDDAWPGDGAWTAWNQTFSGPGRAYALRVEGDAGHAVQVRVRACGVVVASHGCSAWSSAQTAHTVISATQDKVNIYIRGTGKNAPAVNEIMINEELIYRRRDETGLVVAVFSRFDLSLQWLHTYDTHRDRDQSLLMAEDIRRFDQSHFVMVVSSIAWEWHASRTLVKTLEFCGAYHFGMWAHVFAEHRHYTSNRSDLDQSASDSEFGHPYAFVGIPGIGSGMGWESLMYNTGHYEPRNLQGQHAVIRAVAYYDYVARTYRLQEVVTSKSDLYMKNSPPATETVHNPYPSGTIIDSGHDIPEMMLRYKPYIGTMQNHITGVIEANEQLYPYNFVFTVLTYAGLVKVDPRPVAYQITEFDRIWQNASARYFPDGSVHLPGVDVWNRTCKDFVFHAHLEASPDKCGEGFSDCCDLIDWPGFIAAECDVGVAPTLCRDSAPFQLQRNDPGDPAAPYGFRVIGQTS